MIDWLQVTKGVSAQLRNLRADAPEVMQAFSSLAQAATVSKALDAKTKELIALGIAVAVRCDDCIAFHVKAALERGATKDEVTETLGMAIYMGLALRSCTRRTRSKPIANLQRPHQWDSSGLGPAELSSRSLEAPVRFGEEFVSPRPTICVVNEQRSSVKPRYCDRREFRPRSPD
jgi:AhpD family alkylhydroperoxidase